MADQCSIDTYNDLVNSGYIGERQAQVLSIFIEASPNALAGVDAAMKVELLYGPDNTASETVRNRITELEQQGLLEKFDKVRSPVTNRMVNRWRWTGRKEPLPRPERHKCPHCDGKGWTTDDE